jgi:hypothetical protein
MPRAGFHNDNEYRAYPFVFKRSYKSTVELPTATIVDCGFIMGLDSEYAPDEHIIYLHSITRELDTLKFVFKTNAPGAKNFDLTFECATTAEEWQTEFAESAPAAEANFCAEEPAWEGFISLGRLEELITLLPENGTIEFYTPTTVTNTDMPDYTTEPSRVQSLVRAYVRSISVGNYVRPQVPSCAELADENFTPINPEEIIVNAQCLNGNIKIKPGYNCSIQQNATENSISVTAFRRDGGVAEETAEICQYGSELPLFTGQEPPAGSVFLNGGPACGDLITSLSGVTGPNLNIAAGPGIQIVPTSDNSIKIDITPNIIQQNCG